ncbi:MAG: MFS transporter [Bacteroides sp.]|nr:MFS transporter [Roseburia sp.]MCM1346189.1 MFS transporter [Bacteroides sp.]MCM1420674.1 MFS transporter [Bacteroides sp.]
MAVSLRENEGIPSSILLLLAVMAGVSVANIYYCQPLLDMIRNDLGINEFQANLIPMLTQIGYAVGLLVVIPMGDIYNKRTIVVSNIAVLIASLVAFACSDSLHILIPVAFVIGITSVIPQIFMPIASIYSKPEHKERNVGIVLSGLLTGILASRVVSGFIGEWLGWREMYLIASGLMFLSGMLVLRVFPETEPTFHGRFVDLLKTMRGLLLQYRDLRVNATRAGFAFGSFLAMWACLAFKLKDAPFHAGSDAVGLLGLCGIVGVLTASNVGKYVRLYGALKLNRVGVSLMCLAWIVMWLFGDSYAGLVFGVIVIDIGMQCIQLSNQSAVLKLCPSAAGRMNTIFMTTYFVGGSLGTFLAGTAWQLMAWDGVVTAGLLLACASFVVSEIFTRKMRKGKL